MKRISNRNQDEETTYWLSYSDMMAGLLLTFVLIISLTMLHAKMQYDEKETELLGKEQELIIQSDELENEKLTVKDQEEQLNAQAIKLQDQEGKLQLQSQKLKEQEDTLIRQASALREQSDLLEELQGIMDSQQEKLDRIIGVRSDLIEALKEEFEGSNLQISVDENTGAITMDSNILFEKNMDELKESGEEFLSAFMPRYINILLSPKYIEYVSEIIIEGHTDTTGSYLFNLDLSQKRAYSVAAYCIELGEKQLNETGLKQLQTVLTSSGRSFSDPVLKEDGSIDADASRRVEILFRLKDEEMIREMIEILNSDSLPDADNENGGDQSEAIDIAERAQ